MPCSKIHAVASLSICAFGASSPIPKVHAESPTHPSRVAPQSMETKSPSFKMCSSFGIPCTMTSLTDVQILPVKPPYPKKVGIAPASRSEEHTSELQSRFELVCRLLLE